MRESVEKNKGFYIGCYETGTSVARKAGVDNGTTDILVQKGKPLYNYVGWGPDMTSVRGDIIYENKNYGKGAVELSRNLYKGSNSVVSTLCYDVQWDSALQFIYNTDRIYPTNSTDKGNYSGQLINTGSIDAYALNNIYDMAGNAQEWTMAADGTKSRVMRGGAEMYLASVKPAACRDNEGPRSANYGNNGFRIALYLK